MTAGAWTAVAVAAWLAGAGALTVAALELGASGPLLLVGAACFAAAPVAALRACERDDQARR